MSSYILCKFWGFSKRISSKLFFTYIRRAQLLREMFMLSQYYPVCLNSCIVFKGTEPREHINVFVLPTLNKLREKDILQQCSYNCFIQYIKELTGSNHSFSSQHACT